MITWTVNILVYFDSQLRSHGVSTLETAYNCLSLSILMFSLSSSSPSMTSPHGCLSSSYLYSMLEMTLSAYLFRQHSSFDLGIKKPTNTSKIGANIRHHPKNRAQPGRSRGFSNSAMTLAMNVTDMIPTRPYLTIQQTTFGSRSPVALNIIWSSVKISNFHPMINVLASSKKIRGSPTA